jgi:ABC-type antimicrobial peptide transport system permease subunit
MLGAFLPYFVFTYTPVREYPVPLIQHLQIKPPECVEAMIIAIFIGLAAAVWPSWSAYRLNPVAALRRLG